MFTETELREALQHSAGRADARAADDGVETGLPRSAAKTARPWLLPLAAAASIVALTAGVIALVGPTGSTGDSAPAAPPGTQAAGPTVAVSPSVTPRPRAIVDLVDRAVVGVDAEYQFGQVGDLQTGAQTIRYPLGTGRHDGVMTLDIAPKAAIDARRVEQGERVDIAGTTGWYSALKLYPLDGSTGPGSDKWLPHWTIAFRTPSGDWAFAWIELGIEGDDSNLTADDVSVSGSSTIVDAYDRLKVQWKNGAARQSLHFARLPAGTTLSSATFQQVDGKIDSEFVTFSRGEDTLNIEVTSADGLAQPTCVATTKTSAPVSPPVCVGSSSSRDVGGQSVAVNGTGFPASVQQWVGDGVTIATDPSNYLGFEAAVTS